MDEYLCLCDLERFLVSQDKYMGNNNSIGFIFVSGSNLLSGDFCLKYESGRVICKLHSYGFRGVFRSYLAYIGYQENDYIKIIKSIIDTSIKLNTKVLLLENMIIREVTLEVFSTLDGYFREMPLNNRYSDNIWNIPCQK